MHGKLMDLTARELLAKFGAGNHKPGSGSAAAYYGMQSAQLLRTVIELTNESKRRATYAAYLPELLRIKKEIESRICIDLEDLFQKDSEQFDKVITLRDQRDKEQDILKKRILTDQSHEALKIAIDIPLKIADLCIELGNFSTFVFDHGFRAARGDSGAALNGAVSGIGSCLSIIELNLSLIPFDDWMEKAIRHKELVKSKFDVLKKSVDEKLSVLQKESDENILFHKSIVDFRNGNLGDSVRSDGDLEYLVRRLQNTLWQQRDKIFKPDTIEHSIEVLRPEVVLKKVMNYTYSEHEWLGMHLGDDGLFEIAGLIDKNQRSVQVSKNFSKETRTFTAAHELGHTILHRQSVLHRDKPIDGSSGTPKNREEMQADKFAAYFLMPGNLVEDTFELIFQIRKFIINEDTVLGLGAGSIDLLRRQCQNKRGLARMLSSTEYYAGKSFNSLAKVFGVSVETMAIRMEELKLLEF
jgi:formiminotetrahydrofolate cyclodeaminase/Zn-dependent peptidase ImmA (M78 family)